MPLNIEPFWGFLGLKKRKTEMDSSEGNEQIENTKVSTLQRRKQTESRIIVLVLYSMKIYSQAHLFIPSNLE